MATFSLADPDAFVPLPRAVLAAPPPLDAFALLPTAVLPAFAPEEAIAAGPQAKLPALPVALAPWPEAAVSAQTNCAAASRGVSKAHAETMRIVPASTPVARRFPQPFDIASPRSIFMGPLRSDY
jgi:hypothetical protein